MGVASAPMGGGFDGAVLAWQSMVAEGWTTAVPCTRRRAGHTPVTAVVSRASVCHDELAGNPRVLRLRGHTRLSLDRADRSVRGVPHAFLSPP